MKRVTIIGGGITGLASAYYLQKLGRERNIPVAFTLLESERRLGGKIVTDLVEDGRFVVEGGPDSFVVDKPWGLQLCRELSLEDQLIPSNEIDRKVYLLHRGRLQSMPSGFRLTIPTEIGPFLATPLLSLPGKLRMAMDYFIPPRKEPGDESLGSFIRRRLGQEALERIAGPLMSGIFVSDPEKMSVEGTFPTFLEMERRHGSLIRAALAAKKLRKRTGAAPPAMFNSLKKGLQGIVDALRGRLEGDVRSGCSAVDVARGDGRLTVALDGAGRECIATDHVILAVPAFAAAKLLRSVHPALASGLDRFRYVSTATVSMAFLREDIPDTVPLDGYGVLLPPAEKRRLMACTWSSIKFRHRAPADTLLLRVFVGGWNNEPLAELPDAALMDLVRNELATVFGIAAAPMFHRIFRWPKANPQYDVGHLDAVGCLEQLAAEVPGLVLAGSAYRGIGLPDCIKSAIGAVEKVLGP
jgi:protoporphyrinogen/coproporphyrinogen III oxidase